MTIPTRVLGRTGVEVSVLGYGAMELRGQLTGPASQLSAPPIADEDAGRLLNELLDTGISLIDTSIDYGRSEELIGRYLGQRRGEFFLASKCGCSASVPPADAMLAPHDYSAANVRAGVEQSLKHLQTDYLDLVQVHLSPPHEPPRVHPSLHPQPPRGVERDRRHRQSRAPAHKRGGVPRAPAGRPLRRSKTQARRGVTGGFRRPLL